MLDALRDDRGQGLGEYAVVVALIAIACIGAVAFIGSQILSQYHDIGTAYP